MLLYDYRTTYAFYWTHVQIDYMLHIVSQSYHFPWILFCFYVNFVFWHIAHPEQAELTHIQTQELF